MQPNEHLRSNRSVDTDTQRHCAARRASKRTPCGAMPLRAGQLRRYTTAENRSARLAGSRPSRGFAPLPEASSPRQIECRAQAEGRPIFKAAMKAAGWRQSHALLESVGRQVEGRCQLALSVGAAASLSRKAVDLGAAGPAQPPELREIEGRRVEGRPSAQSVGASPQGSAAGGAHNRSIDTDVDAAGCAGLCVAGHFRR